MFSQIGADRAVTFTGGGRFRRVNFHTMAPARLDLGAHRQAANVRLSLGSGQAAVDATMDNGAMDAKATVSNVDLSILRPGLRGAVSTPASTSLAAARS